MSKLEQKKLHLTLDELFDTVARPIEDDNWKLVRERDDLTLYSADVMWLEFNEDRTYKAKQEQIGIGCSLLMSPFTFQFTWQTTMVTEIVEVTKEYTKFKTKNSNYILYKI